MKAIRDKILVVGGYGNVGQVICGYLAEKFPGKVIVAGRSYQKAESYSRSTAGATLPMELDVADNHGHSRFMDEVLLVIMCLDQKDTSFIKTCISSGIHYMDITASYWLISEIEKMAELAERNGSTTVLSVGLTPGISNLLVKHCSRRLGTLREADIYILLGMGDEHGKAAIEWTVDNINTAYYVVENGKSKEVKSFMDGKETIFPTKLGKRRAYRFDFSDQHVLPKTLGIKTVSTRMCFDSVFLTEFLAILKKLGFLNLLKLKSIRRLFVKMIADLRLGSDIFAVKVEAIGEKEGGSERCCSVTGRGEGLITGRTAGLVAEKIYTGAYPSGVYHIEQLFEPEEIFGKLEKNIEISLW